MTFRVETVFDQDHKCPQSPNVPDHVVDLDSRTWTCRTCQQPVLIDMTDKAGNSYTVERRPAREIRRNDYIVYRVKSGLASGLVNGSNPHKFTKGKWYLAVEDFGSDSKLSPEQYISRIS